MSSSDQNQFVIALVALVISVVALFGTILQLLQQYFASAVGYSNVGQKVIGEWHKTKRRKFRLEELRFEVQFEAPVIFVCPPSHQRGPVKGAQVWHIDGTDTSITNTKTTQLSKDEHQLALDAAAAKNVHTADNEQATWVLLLQELQRMERDSSNWEMDQYKHNAPRSLVSKFADHTLCAAVQAKKRTWDTMPSSINKPYATTTFCHIIEIAAMLGIYWKEFNRATDKYRAEGNGYVLTGSNNSDLGLLFSFQVSGKCQFESNRIVPCNEAKAFMFGIVPTIFKDVPDNRHLDFTTEDQTDLNDLYLGSINEVAETLVSFGCNTGASNTIRNDKKKHGHLFPCK